MTCIQVALAHQSATHEFLPCPTSQCWCFQGLNPQTTHQQNPPSIYTPIIYTLPWQIGLNNERFPCFTSHLRLMFDQLPFWHSESSIFRFDFFSELSGRTGSRAAVFREKSCGELVPANFRSISHPQVRQH